jgi:proteasome accessory factor C
MPALERLRRLLAVVPWVVEQDGPLIDEVAVRFDYDRDELLDDLEKILFFVGIYPFTPDCLIEVWLTEDRVWIRYADWFRRPFRLSMSEIGMLVAAGTTVVGLLPWNSDDDAELGPLERALAKLSALTDGSDRTVEIRLGTTGSLLATVSEAVNNREALEVEYHSFHRDEVGTRVVEPHRYYADKGYWYLVGYCRSAGAQRTFRLDRIRTCEPTGERFTAPEEGDGVPEGVPLDGRLPEVVLELDPEARWVVDEYPHTGVEETSEGQLKLRLPVVSERWLERLLVRLGPHATVVEAPDGLGVELRAATAHRILARYLI